jgi:hypothetical protein
MTNKAIDPTRLNDLAAAVGFSVKEANKAKVSALLASIRNGSCGEVMCCPRYQT